MKRKKVGLYVSGKGIWVDVILQMYTDSINRTQIGLYVFDMKVDVIL